MSGMVPNLNPTVEVVDYPSCGSFSQVNKNLGMKHVLNTIGLIIRVVLKKIVKRQI
jgi:hypothetical protein